MKNSYKISIPADIHVSKKKNILKISGPLGSTFLDLKTIDPDGDSLFFLQDSSKEIHYRTHNHSFFGLFQSLFSSKCRGVARGFLVYLRMSGIGYRAFLEGDVCILKVGYSHDIYLTLPRGVCLFSVDPTLLCLYGVDKNQVSQIAAQIRQCRTPDAYKGKGIRLLHEKIEIKQGKKK